MMRITLTEHAVMEMRRRAVPEEVLRAVVESPESSTPSRKGRVVLQGGYFDPQLGKDMLLRVVGVHEPESFKVITLYKTSKFEKYRVTGGRP